MKRSPIAAYFWGAVHHPEFHRCRWMLLPPALIFWHWARWNTTLTLRIQMQAPIVLFMDYRVLDDYARLELNDPYWDDIPF